MKYEAVEQAKTYLLEKTGSAPDVAVIMGSGVSAVDEILTNTIRIHYVTIPNFPLPKVEGHRGEVIFGKARGLHVVVFEGRSHYYDANLIDDAVFAVRVAGRIGAQTVLLTNSAGAVNTSFSVGKLMLITDHINLMGMNPLAGANEDRWGPRFIDQTEVYDPGLRKKLLEAASHTGIQMLEGVYAAVHGPAFETPAEVRYLRTIGADAVGMSTVPEAIAARHMGLKVAGISMLANLAAGISGAPILHEEVLTMTAQMNADVGMLLHRFFEIYPQ
jgi:purine-nucleoside phosphorylase